MRSESDMRKDSLLRAVGSIRFQPHRFLFHFGLRIVSLQRLKKSSESPEGWVVVWPCWRGMGYVSERRVIGTANPRQ